MADLPTGWDRVSLGDAAVWLSGGTPKTDTPEYWGGEIPWISSGSLVEWNLKRSDRTLTELGLNSGSRLVPSGTTLFVVRGMSLKTEFRIGIAKTPVAFGQDLKALRAKEGIEAGFLAYAIKAQTETILELVDEAGHGTGRLNTDQLKALTIPLPPLSEQRAITELLGALDDKIESNLRIAVLLDELFHLEWKMRFECENSEAWPMAKLGEFCGTQYGFTASASPENIGPKLLRVMDINKKNWIDWWSVPHAPATDHDRSKFGLKLGDLLIARMADPGKSAIVETDSVDAVFASYLVRLKPANLADSYFLYGFLKSPSFLEFAEGASSGSVQENMNARVMGEAEFRLPPDVERTKFLDAVVESRKLLNHVVEEVHGLSALRDSLLPQLFSGRLRTRSSSELIEAS